MFPNLIDFSVNFMLTLETKDGSILFYKTIRLYETLSQYFIFIMLVI